METLEADKQKEAKQAAQKEVTKEKGKEEIMIEDFTKVELKVGTILSAESTRKQIACWVEQIDLGDEVRQIVSGIAST